MMMTRFPISRPRRLRLKEHVRDLISDVRLSQDNFILPIFVNDNIRKPIPIDDLEGHNYYPPESPDLTKFLDYALELGVKSFLIFGVPSRKDFYGSEAWSRQGVVQKAIRYIRRELGDSPVIFTDLCLCGYTDHGHCGLPKDIGGSTIIDNDSTLELYGKIAVSHAEAGADFIAPSGMMDGQVKYIRESLDREGFNWVGIMSYSVKFSSSFYGPFRGVMDSSPRHGDRRSYQMDYRNRYEALKEVMMDLEEGADIIMVKPALAYLDIIRMVKEEYPYIPLAAYNVSGEYMMVKVAAKNGVFEESGIIFEVLTSIKRAGADIIISYHAIEAAKILKNMY